MTRPTASKAFALIELLSIIAILAAVALISMRLLRSTLNMSQGMADAHAARSQYDHSMTQLRQDVWHASSIRVSEPGQLTVQTHDGLITWAYDPEAHCLTRTAGSSVSTWRDLARTIRFESIAGGARIRWEDGATRSAIVVDLPSQVLLAGGQP